MKYETIAAISQSATLILFIGLFVIVVGYTFWPKNRDRLEHASRVALDLETKSHTSGGR